MILAYPIADNGDVGNGPPSEDYGVLPLWSKLDDVDNPSDADFISANLDLSAPGSDGQGYFSVSFSPFVLPATDDVTLRIRGKQSLHATFPFDFSVEFSSLSGDVPFYFDTTSLGDRNNVVLTNVYQTIDIVIPRATLEPHLNDFKIRIYANYSGSNVDPTATVSWSWMVLAGPDLPAEPDAPTNLAAVQSAWNTVDLDWDVTPDTDTYRVERNVNGGDYEELTDGLVTNSYSDEIDDPVDGDTYCYRITAINDLGESIPSSSDCVALDFLTKIFSFICEPTLRTYSQEHGVV